MSVWTYIFWAILVAGINLMFQDNLSRKRYRNLYQDIAYDSIMPEQYDSILKIISLKTGLPGTFKEPAGENIDSLIVTFKK